MMPQGVAVTGAGAGSILTRSQRVAKVRSGPEAGGGVMEWFIKQEPVRRAPPGLEWRIFKRLPWIFIAGLVLLAAGAGLVRLTAAEGADWQVAAAIRQADFALFGALLYFIEVLLVTAIGCVLVMVMKGPHYSADSYEVPNADRPPPREVSDGCGPSAAGPGPGA